MNEQELTRLIAAELGPDVTEAIENPILAGSSRSFGTTEAMATAGFAASCIRVAIEVWKVRQDRALLTLALAEALQNGDGRLASKLEPEKQLSMIARVVNAIVPDTYSSSPSIQGKTPRSKREWLMDWTGQGNDARAMTQPILVPFADMDNWIVFKPIYWTPPAGCPSSLPSVVNVPAGFVSDLATIPPYFWWALPPSGRYGHAAILHDWLYWEQSCTRAIADKVFEVAMEELAVDVALRKAMWAAVRIGGGQYWQEATLQKRRGGSGRVLKRFPDTPVTWKQWRSDPGVFV